MEIVKTLSKIFALPLVVLVWVYQKTLSFDHGPLKIFFPYGYCKFYPSCSSYAFLILKKDGIIGLPRIIKRVANCTPNSLGGVDLPYKEFKQS